MRCAVYGCNSNNQKREFKKPVRFYTFPKDNVNLWVNACCRPNKFNAKNARICSRHFKDSDFERNLAYELLNYLPRKGRKLKPNAVPTLCLPKGKSYKYNYNYRVVECFIL